MTPCHPICRTPCSSIRGPATIRHQPRARRLLVNTQELRCHPMRKGAETDETSSKKVEYTWKWLGYFLPLEKKRSLRKRLSWVIGKTKKHPGLPWWLRQNLPSMSNLSSMETWVWFLGWEDPLEKRMATHSSILAREFNGQRNLAGYSPSGRKELDTTEWLTLQYREKKKSHILTSLNMCLCDPCLLVCSIISIRLIARCGIDEAKAYTF